jgi:hypothetical protein
LPDHLRVDWRAARGGDNQVCAVYARGGTRQSNAAADAAWLVAAAGAWLTALSAHPIPDLATRVRNQGAP